LVRLPSPPAQDNDHMDNDRISYHMNSLVF